MYVYEYSTIHKHIMCCAANALQKKNTWRHFNVIVKATQSKTTYERTQTTHIPERVLYIRARSCLFY